ncbi:MAG: DUF1501 domain-containing protein [Planctomycetota bacterium]|nr:DUF1501 domain-containing protein [Planctomycetota bacterium]
MNELDRRKWMHRAVAAGGLGLAGTAWWLSNSQREQSSDEIRVTGIPQRRPEPHFAARAKNVICLFMAGAPSQVDLFDPKPRLRELNGKTVSLEGRSPVSALEPTSYFWPSPYKFASGGQSGIEVSDLLPNTRKIVDELCVVRSMVTDTSNHHPGQHMWMTGVTRYGHPALGAWVSYGLGSANEELPGYIVLSSGQGTAAGASNWSSGFMPSRYQGVPLRSTGEPILYLKAPRGIDGRMQRKSMELISQLNAEHYRNTNDLTVLESMQAYEAAFRLQSSAPELMDLSDESSGTLDAYRTSAGTGGFAMNCLLARRLVEKGVRFVQLNHSSWDAHKEICDNHEGHCKAIDQPIAALIEDLRQRGLLDETLVVWGGEFGRTPTAEHRRKESMRNIGRDHQASGFTIWMAGGGIKSGHVHGSTDEVCLDVAENPVHVHDLQATILHCLGLDHEKLTFPYLGRQHRLTDTGGEVVHELLA